MSGGFHGLDTPRLDAVCDRPALGHDSQALPFRNDHANQSAARLARAMFNQDIFMWALNVSVDVAERRGYR
jgi:hypothetical protein